jgi:hypothetical protein
MGDKTELMKALTRRFIQVTLDDGSVHAGYIGNPEDFRGEEMPETMVLVNGLLKDSVEVARVADVSFPSREATTEIPVLDSDTVKNEENQ